MLTDRSIAMVLAIALLAAPARTQALPARPDFSRSGSAPTSRMTESLSSRSAAERFGEIAQEIADADHVTGPQADQAILLLTAAKSLNSELAGVEPLLLRLATRHAQRDYSPQVFLWLQNYVGPSADRVIVTEAVRYLLDRSNSREGRKELLETLLARIGNKNAAIDSELATQLGLLLVEKGDLGAAQSYLLQAYTSNKYNKVAFAKLAELAPNEIGPAAYLEHLRLVVRANPLDINAALNFAQYTERLQLYDVAAQSYQYCAELFRYLYPSEPLPPHIYLPWAISCYNTERGQHICLQIAENVRKMGRFDILLEAIAGRAAARIGNPEEARRIFREAEQKARQLLQSGPEQAPSAQQGGAGAVRQVNARQFAWFYCLADPNAAKALDWANRGYSVEPNSPSASALLAYALSMSNQLEWARPLLASSESGQIADLVQARIELSEGRKEAGIQTLKMAITKDAGSLAAERAREMLRELGSEYTPPIDPGAVLTFLTERLGRTIAPQFLPPDKMIEVQFNIRGNEFSYGNELEGTIAIVNKASEPLVISPDSLFQGNIRVSARVGGDIKKEIPRLVSGTMCTELTVQPGRSLIHPVRLSTGELRDILMTYPQASLEIQFTLYLDPVQTGDGSLSNRLVDVKPVTISVTRPRVEITAGYVRDRYNAISSGQEGQKIRTAQLFTGLLKEQYAMGEQGTLYPFKYAQWLPELLRSALLADSGLLLREGERVGGAGQYDGQHAFNAHRPGIGCRRGAEPQPSQVAGSLDGRVSPGEEPGKQLQQGPGLGGAARCQRAGPQCRHVPAIGGIPGRYGSTQCRHATLSVGSVTLLPRHRIRNSCLRFLSLTTRS
jgi:hypothetical protein